MDDPHSSLLWAWEQNQCCSLVVRALTCGLSTASINIYFMQSWTGKGETERAMTLECPTAQWLRYPQVPNPTP